MRAFCLHFCTTGCESSGKRRGVDELNFKFKTFLLIFMDGSGKFFATGWRNQGLFIEPWLFSIVFVNLLFPSPRQSLRLVSHSLSLPIHKMAADWPHFEPQNWPKSFPYLLCILTTWSSPAGQWRVRSVVINHCMLMSADVRAGEVNRDSWPWRERLRLPQPPSLEDGPARG